MADQVTVDNGGGTDYTVSTDDAGASGHVQRVKLAYSADGSATHVQADADGVLVNLGANNDVTVTGTVTANLSATDNAVLDNIDANTDSLAVVGGGVQATALRVTLASDSTGVLSVDDNGSTISVDDGGGALTVDGTVGVSGTVTVDSELPAAAALADNTANPTVPAVGSFGMVFDGSTWDRQTQPLTDTQLRASAVPVSLASVPSHAVTNAGTFATQVDGAALTALQLIDDIVKTDDAAFTPATDEVAMAGFFADETSTDSVDEGDAGAARMTLDRKQIVVNQPHTAGGCSIFRSIDLDETEEEAKATAGCVYGYYIANLATSTRFVKFYNATAANVTVGTTTPVLTLPIPGNSTDDVGANMLGGVGITFDTAITVAATTGVADNDTGAPGANEVVINLYYK